MAKFRVVFGLFFVGAMILSFSACKQDNPTIVLPDKHTGPTENGDIEVFCRQGTPMGAYLGGAKVELFLTQTDRDNESVAQTNLTPLEQTTEKGALFKSLPYQKYYFRATWENQGIRWQGVDEAFAIKGSTTKIHIVLVQ